MLFACSSQLLARMISSKIAGCKWPFRTWKVNLLAFSFFLKWYAKSKIDCWSFAMHLIIRSIALSALSLFKSIMAWSSVLLTDDTWSRPAISNTSTIVETKLANFLLFSCFNIIAVLSNKYFSSLLMAAYSLACPILIYELFTDCSISSNQPSTLSTILCSLKNVKFDLKSPIYTKQSAQVELRTLLLNLHFEASASKLSSFISYIKLYAF